MKMEIGKHTQGPWHIVVDDDETRLSVRGPNDEFVADCADGFWSDEADGWIMAEESEHNARLIIAAPLMAQTLQKILPFLGGSHREIVLAALEEAGL